MAEKGEEQRFPLDEVSVRIYLLKKKMVWWIQVWVKGFWFLNLARLRWSESWCV